MFEMKLELVQLTPPGSARADLLARGTDVSPVVDVGGGVKYASFSDPDGNTLTLQEMAWRTGDSY